MKPFNEWTEYASDFEIVFATNATGKVHKVCEWRLISDTEMHYTAYNEDGSINMHHIHTGEGILEIWRRYHTKEKQQ